MLQLNRPSSVQRLILPAGSSQVPIRPVLSSGPVPPGAQIIRTTVPAVSGNLGQLAAGGATFITAGATGQGVQGFALVPASYLSQVGAASDCLASLFYICNFCHFCYFSIMNSKYTFYGTVNKVH